MLRISTVIKRCQSQERYLDSVSVIVVIVLVRPCSAAILPTLHGVYNRGGWNSVQNRDKSASVWKNLAISDSRRPLHLHTSPFQIELLQSASYP